MISLHQEYLDARNRTKRFIVDALGEGLHYLPGLISNEPPLAVVVVDYDDESEIEILPQDMAEALNLEWVAHQIAKSQGLIPTFELPQATDAEYQSVKASIARFGVQQPILVDENGRIINGRLRKRACDELGIECPSLVVGKLSLSQKQQLAFDLDSCRKHFKTSAKKRLARFLLRTSPANSDRMIACAADLDHKTVGKLRTQMKQGGEIPHHTHVVGKDGKKYKFPTIRAKSKGEVKKAVELLEKLGPDAPNREIELRQSKRMVRAHNKNQAGLAFVAPLVSDSDIQILHRDFRTLEVADESVDFIFTDPPYPQEFLPLYGDLAAFAARVLKPGGLMLAYCGVHYLDSVMKLLGQHLQYHWQCILRHTSCTALAWIELPGFVRNWTANVSMCQTKRLRMSMPLELLFLLLMKNRIGCIDIYGGIYEKAIDEFKRRGCSTEDPALQDRLPVEHGEGARAKPSRRKAGIQHRRSKQDRQSTRS